MVTMYKPIKIVCIVFIFAANIFAQRKPVVSTTRPELLTKLERVGCGLGPCALYNIEIYNNGIVYFDGISGTRVRGKIRGQIPLPMLTKISRMFDEAHFFTLENNLPADVDGHPVICLDSSSDALTYNKNGKAKRVQYECGPDNLNNIAYQIDMATQSKQWIFYDVETLKSNIRHGLDLKHLGQIIMYKAIQWDDTGIMGVLAQHHIKLEPEMCWSRKRGKIVLPKNNECVEGDDLMIVHPFLDAVSGRNYKAAGFF
jgi:hypothetical protein